MTYTTEWIEQIMVIRLEGDLIGGFSTQTMLDEVNEKITEGTRLCAVDIEQVRYMNSTGIDVLITLLTKFRNKGGEIVIINPSEQVKKTADHYQTECHLSPGRQHGRGSGSTQVQCVGNAGQQTTEL